MSLKSCINTINKQLKANFKFIKYDGMILDTFSEKLLKKNEMNLQKTIEYLDTLSKKDIIESFECIVKEIETVKEINDVYKNTIQKNKDEIELLQEKYDKLIEINSGLETSMETSMKTSMNKAKQIFEECKKQDETDLINFAIYKYEENEKLKTMTDEATIKFNENILKQETKLKVLTDAIDGVYRNEIYEDEFNIPKSQFVEKGRLLQLKPDIYSVDNGLLFSNHKDNYFKELNVYENTINKKLVFNYDKLLPENEYVILIRIETHHAYIPNHLIINNSGIKYYIDEFNVIYITNYGRIIKIKPELNLHCPTDYCGHPGYLQYMPMTNIIYKQNKLYNQSGYHPYREDEILDYELQSLSYRMPILFLTVIEAFQQQNTDMMQECCKKYLDITRESQRKTEILTSLQYNKTVTEKDAIITKKNDMIKENEAIIEYQTIELEKLKNEIAKLKKALSSFVDT